MIRTKVIEVNFITMVSALLIVALLSSALVQVVVPAMLGAPESLERGSEIYSKIVRMAASHISLSSNSKIHMWINQVHSVTRQVMAGVFYKVRLEMDYTSCSKATTPIERADNCRLADGINDYPDLPHPFQMCEVDIMDHPWAEGLRVVKSDCKSMSWGSFVANYSR